MDLLSLIILILLVLWLAGALGSAPAAAPQNIVWIISDVALVIWLVGGYGRSHSGHWWQHR